MVIKMLKLKKSGFCDVGFDSAEDELHPECISEKLGDEPGNEAS